MTHLIHTKKTRENELRELRKIAKNNGGKCLSKKYQDNKTKLLWECAEGHQWSAISSTIRRGGWCQVCFWIKSGRARANSIDDAHSIAALFGGKCLSQAYTNNSEKMRWQCKHGHEWLASYSSLKSTPARKGSWCPICAGKLPPSMALAQLQALAKSKGGRLLSDCYLTAKTKLEWQCSEGHSWRAIPDSVRRGTWCPICARIERNCRPDISISDAQSAAKMNDGSCLSKKYKNYLTKLEWKCKNGHRFKMRLGHVEEGHWCPRCSAGRSERLCAALFEYISGEEFRKTRPKWLLNIRGNAMELDGYCEKLGIAFEFHGEQHFDNIPFFHSNGKTVQKQKAIDKKKRQLCKKHGVTLIEVPISVEPDSMQKYIINQIEAANMGHTIKNRRTIELDDLDLSPDNLIFEYHKIARDRGGKCLSKVYLNNHTKLTFECNQGHKWQAVPSSVKGGTWCPKCGDQRASRIRAHTIDHIKEVAESRGGKCLSEHYNNSKDKLKWECSEGHKWEARSGHVLKGHWCPQCGKAKLARLFSLSIDDMKETAASRGGICLSDSYENSRSRLRWKCSEGHEWEAIANSVRRGSWCPTCSGRKASRGRAHTISEMRKIAESRGGRCLSNEYRNLRTRLDLVCAKGHHWTTSASVLVKGHWCPKCAATSRK